MSQRVVISIVALLAAALTAIVFGVVAHDDLGIGTDTIRTDALMSAGFVSFLVAGANYFRPAG
jgi:hypothetical protein